MCDNVARTKRGTTLWHAQLRSHSRNFAAVTTARMLAERNCSDFAFQMGSYAPSAAVYVRYLFSRYLAGANAHEIAEEFLRRSANEPVLSRRKWTHRTVIEMLINEKYTGDVLHQKTYMTETLPRQCVRNHGQVDQYYVSSVHPAIIDRDSFQAAQELLQKRKKDHPPHRRRASVFIGTAVCAKCGGGFRSCESSGKRYCVCRRHAHNADACDMPPIPEDAIMQAFLRLYDNLKHGEILQFTQKTLSTIRSRKMLWSTDIVELNQRISENFRPIQSESQIVRAEPAGHG